ncbi:hypothetical protein HK405_008007 [Cladochytrium tenue]|nr:hypothetical protein HK405_008007 [Cladochytrium tenue]
MVATTVAASAASAAAAARTGAGATTRLTPAYYRFWLPVQTRFDTVVNAYLVRHCGLRPTDSSAPGGGSSSNTAVRDSSPSSSSSAAAAAASPAAIGSGSGVPRGLVVASSATYHRPASFPGLLRLGLAVGQLGRTSATYHIGVFSREDDDHDDHHGHWHGHGHGGLSSNHAIAAAATAPTDAAWACCVTGTFTHVFVGADGRPTPMPAGLRAGLARLEPPPPPVEEEGLATGEGKQLEGAELKPQGGRGGDSGGSRL